MVNGQRTDRGKNLRWVLQELQRLPGATAKHLLQLSVHRGSGPKRETLYSVIRDLRKEAPGGPLIDQASEPGGENGFFLTEQGLCELYGDLPDGAGKWLTGPSAASRRHDRITVDLAVAAELQGAVVRTEFEGAAIGGEANVRSVGTVDPCVESGDESQPTLSPTGHTRVPDLVIAFRSVTWAVEVERTHKGTEDGEGRYTKLVRVHLQQRFRMGDRIGPVNGVWYLTNASRYRARRPTAEVVVRGVFSAAEQCVGDLVLVVQPFDLDRLSERGTDARLQTAKDLIVAAAPVMGWTVEGRDPTEPFDMRGAFGYVSTSPKRSPQERPPKKIESLAVVAVGKYSSGAPPSILINGVSALALSYGFDPSELAVAPSDGDRVVAFGRMSRSGSMRAENLRVLDRHPGTDLHPPG